MLMNQYYTYLNRCELMLTRYLCLILIALFSINCHAAWFEASGQAAIENGNTDVARQNATQEAIKQALLFAGASVKSVQSMANGLLENDRFEVRSAGEVSSIELIDEIYSDGFVTVAIRADIFSQPSSCDGSDYNKTIATMWHPIAHREQATVGGIFEFGAQLPKRLSRHFLKSAQHSQIVNIEPFYHQSKGKVNVNEITTIARNTQSQYVLTGLIEDVSVTRNEPSSFEFWKSPTAIRQFAYRSRLFDGFTGELLWEKSYEASSPWEIGLHQQVDVSSNTLWQSKYGQLVEGVLQDITSSIDEKLSCLPAYGRILQVQGGTLHLNIGEHHGVDRGDELTLFQVNQFYDPQGMLHSQFNIHPTKVKVTEVFANSAMAIAKDNTLLANIQANDFVSRR